MMIYSYNVEYFDDIYCSKPHMHVIVLDAPPYGSRSQFKYYAEKLLDPIILLNFIYRSYRNEHTQRAYKWMRSIRSIYK